MVGCWVARLWDSRNSEEWIMEVVVNVWRLKEENREWEENNEVKRSDPISCGTNPPKWRDMI